MAEQDMRKRVSSPDEEQGAYRVPPGEGRQAPPPEELGHAEHSTFDGAGNEVVVVTGTDSEGNIARGFGATREEAIRDLDRPVDRKNLVGD